MSLEAQLALLFLAMLLAFVVTPYGLIVGLRRMWPTDHGWNWRWALLWVPCAVILSADLVYSIMWIVFVSR